MAAAPEIQVHAEFPHAVTLDAGDLNINPTNWHWVHCLSFPIETLNTLQFSQRPYKWIRYAIGVVTGMQGDLSLAPNTFNAVDYNTTLPLASEPAILYYHTSDVEKRTMFPVDPYIVRSEITSSVRTTRRAHFRDEVSQRDQGRCALTRYEDEDCDAAHLITRSKGNEYISTWTRRRSRSLAGNDIVEEIDSIRNGLFLNVVIHRNLGKHVAFLTPNFAMDTTDIEPDAIPTEKRCTAHLFRLKNSPFVSGSPLQMPAADADSNWPPDIIFDVVYGGAVLYHFATQEVEDVVNKTWKKSYYSEGVTTAAKAVLNVIEKQRNEAKAKRDKQAEECQAGYENHQGWQYNYADMLLILPYMRVARDQLMAVCEEAEEKRAEKEQRLLKEKVKAWVKEVSSASE